MDPLPRPNRCVRRLALYPGHWKVMRQNDEPVGYISYYTIGSSAKG
jgi:hypothetical protein